MRRIFILFGIIFLYLFLPNIDALANTANRGMGLKIKAKNGREVGLYKESHALVIGVSQYTGGWRQLPGVKRDVKAVSKALRTNGFHVVVKEDLNQRELESAYQDFILEYGQDPDNRLLFYFSGHGHTIKPSWASDNPEEWRGYIVSKEAPDPGKNKEGFLRHALSMTRVNEMALSIESKHALFIFDSCFSGLVMTMKSGRISPDIAERTAKPVRQFITSGSADQEVPDDSIFRRQFIEALEGEADGNKDGYLTGTELGDYLIATVTNYSNRTQIPQVGKIRHPRLDKGDFVFQLRSNPSSSPLKQEQQIAGLAPNIGNIMKEMKSSDGRYIAHGDGTVTDTKTGLMWTQKDSYADLRTCLDWDDSKSYVNNLAAGGYRDWRLPTISELERIYSLFAFLFEDNGVVSPLGGPLGLDKIFSGVGVPFAWSSERAGFGFFCCAKAFNLTSKKVHKFDRDFCDGTGVRGVRQKG